MEMMISRRNLKETHAKRQETERNGGAQRCVEGQAEGKTEGDTLHFSFFSCGSSVERADFGPTSSTRKTGHVRLVFQHAHVFFPSNPRLLCPYMGSVLQMCIFFVCSALYRPAHPLRVEESRFEGFQSEVWQEASPTIDP